MDIPGIPASIPRARVVELVESLGINVHDLRSLVFNVHAIEAEAFARNEQGQRFVADDEHMAIHRIVIPIEDQLDNPPEPQPA